MKVTHDSLLHLCFSTLLGFTNSLPRCSHYVTRRISQSNTKSNSCGSYFGGIRMLGGHWLRHAEKSWECRRLLKAAPDLHPVGLDPLAVLESKLQSDFQFSLSAFFHHLREYLLHFASTSFWLPSSFLFPPSPSPFSFNFAVLITQTWNQSGWLHWVEPRS